MKFDYVIIGAGSAGCVLAHRLSQNGRYSVCILEAGGRINSALVNTPAAFAAFMFLKKYNWSFSAKKDPKIRHGQGLFVPRGKGLGGSSSINGMIYIRGQKEDYDQWQQLGNEGWSYTDLLPYFRKSETNERGGDDIHGDTGPIHVSNRPVFYPISRRFVAGAQQAGFEYTEDFNGFDQEGVGYYQFTMKNGERCGAARAYLEPALSRPNLTVLAGAQVKRILIEGGEAKGVEYVQNGRSAEVIASKSVILSAGAIHSPQLLMLSGIGDADELRQHGIDCVKHLPGVGKNLQEHVDACVLVRSKKRDGFTTSLLGILRLLPDVFKYMFKRTGKLSTSVSEAGAFLKSRSDVKTPDIQLHMLPLLFDDSGRDLKLMAQHGYSCHVCVLRPQSRGTISLASANFQESPIIDFNFFSDPAGEDKRVLVDGIRQVRKIMSTEAFADYRLEEAHPGDDAQSDDEIFAKAKERLGLVYHPVGTCKMGNDGLAVVDSQLKVRGIEKLRVVDASIMPTLISGNTNAPTIAIAEKAADLILFEAD